MSWLGLIQQWTGRKIILYADFIDPFCFIGFHALKPLAEERGIELEWRGFELNPNTPNEGLHLETASNSDIRPGMWASVQALAQKQGLTLPEPGFIPNTRCAHALALHARHPRVKNPLIEQIYQAYFNRHADIGQIDVLIDLARAFEITAEQVKTACGDPQLSVQLETYRTQAQSRGFLGMPGFVYKTQSYFGALSREAWGDIFKGGSHRGR